jgi:hypothetical protein
MSFTFIVQDVFKFKITDRFSNEVIPVINAHGVLSSGTLDPSKVKGKNLVIHYPEVPFIKAELFSIETFCCYIGKILAAPHGSIGLIIKETEALKDKIRIGSTIFPDPYDIV